MLDKATREDMLDLLEYFTYGSEMQMYRLYEDNTLISVYEDIIGDASCIESLNVGTDVMSGMFMRHKSIQERLTEYILLEDT